MSFHFKRTPSSSSSSKTPQRDRKYDERRAGLKVITDGTLAALERGFYKHGGVTYTLRQTTEEAKSKTRFYDADSLLSAWSKGSLGSASTISPYFAQQPAGSGGATSKGQDIETKFSILEISTLEGARYLANPPDTHTHLDASPSRSTSNSHINSRPAASKKIGILNFASATKPGGGFLNGAQAQEESIARSSNLYPTLMTDSSQRFYKLHTKDSKGGYYTHAMIYSPGVLVFRTDDGGWTEPLAVDVLTSPAVNAGVVRRTVFGAISPRQTEERIEKVMRARMGRILSLFEKEGVKSIVLGSFGTGVFQNNVDVVARLWAELLAVKGARFGQSFEKVVFAILGRETILEFEKTWNQITDKVEAEEDHESDVDAMLL